MADRQQNPRLMLSNFLSLEQCKELEFIHKSCSTVGYRPSVFSTTLSHLIATNSAHLIVPLVLIREKLKEKVEEFFACEYELCIEFTGLVSWTKGASIGWHSDDNRPYLKQRNFAAVCYLNSYGRDFRGGLFHFQDGEPTTVKPSAGDVLIYTADNRNVHSVDEIIDGERLTLTLWFSRDGSHDEDAKLISRLSEIFSSEVTDVPGFNLPLPASSNMYWFSPDQSSDHDSAINICCARIYALGFGICPLEDKTNFLDVSDLLMKLLQLTRNNGLFNQEFENVLHALQVVQYYSWKASELQGQATILEEGKVIPLSRSQSQKVRDLESACVKDCRLAQTTFGCLSCDRSGTPEIFRWGSFSAAVDAWRDYTNELHKDLLRSLPYWRNHQLIFHVAFDEL
ncbi:uncharacterized protein LOC115757182 isoform X1 [Rhodamnia argentea]|uniref:procollagen-proline 3-dioxygenase n=1 Tax=Rhodamnia argentea TaxID=178133 RepID=A0A8B8R1B2_9MYRT|nr:uncharacterized protein LOC115757182 isoform X1 [Rhodamnia argentea]